MKHVPVLLEEVVESLQLKPGMNIVDGTLGDAGHAGEILERTAPKGMLLGIDSDPESILRAKKYLNKYFERVVYERDNFVGLADIVKEKKFGPIHGVLLDLGWSSPQFEERKRGFSFQNLDEPLDMRYDKRRKCKHPMAGDYYEPCTGASVINNESEKELTRIFSNYGEEKFAKEIAKEIVKKRKDFELETVKDLVNIILEVYRTKLKTNKEVPWIGGNHPATKVFQALRIYVNEELTAIKETLPQAIEVLEPGGRLAVISFHSLEDRIVKHYFKKENSKSLEIITKKPIVAKEGEIHRNPRSRSAKLRVVEKI
jgi:16S rRNA (cytosine1402-N4)-methyltransferase